jgi:hypothetical protein
MLCWLRVTGCLSSRTFADAQIKKAASVQRFRELVIELKSAIVSRDPRLHALPHGFASQNAGKLVGEPRTV